MKAQNYKEYRIEIEYDLDMEGWNRTVWLGDELISTGVISEKGTDALESVIEAIDEHLKENEDNKNAIY